MFSNYSKAILSQIKLFSCILKKSDVNHSNEKHEGLHT